jgi:phosphate transport system permease protein
VTSPDSQEVTVNGETAVGRRQKSPTSSGAVYRAVLVAGLAVAGLIGAGYFILIISRSVPGWQFAGRQFFTSTHWFFSNNEFGALPLVMATIITTGLALLIAIPVGVGSAVAIVYVVPHRLKLLASSLVELLAIVPSVVYGVWGALVIQALLGHHIEPWLSVHTHGVWPFNGPYSGFGIFLGSIILAVMILPIVVAVSRDVIAIVPDTLIEGSLAVGASRSQVIRKVVLPSCRSGIVGAVTLATGRALGETIALATVMGGVNNVASSGGPLPDRLFATGETLASEIAADFGSAQGKYLGVMFCLAVVLLVIVGLVNGFARRIIRKTQAQFQ